MPGEAASEFRNKTKRSGPSRARPSHGGPGSRCTDRRRARCCVRVAGDRGRACSVSPGGPGPLRSPESPYSEICHVFALHIPLPCFFLFVCLNNRHIVLCTMGREQLVSSAKPPWAVPGAPRCSRHLALLAQAARAAMTYGPASSMGWWAPWSRLHPAQGGVLGGPQAADTLPWN